MAASVAANQETAAENKVGGLLSSKWLLVSLWFVLFWKEMWNGAIMLGNVYFVTHLGTTCQGQGSQKQQKQQQKSLHDINDTQHAQFCLSPCGWGQRKRQLILQSVLERLNRRALVTSIWLFLFFPHKFWLRIICNRIESISDSAHPATPSEPLTSFLPSVLTSLISLSVRV